MKTRIITAVVGLIVLAGVLFTFDTLVFNLVIAAITLIALHEIYSALGFEKQDWPLLAVLVPYTLLIMLSSYSVFRAMVMPASFLVVLFYAIYLVVRNGVISYQKASGLAMFSGIVIFCFYSFIRLKEMLPVEEYGYDAIFFILLILCFAWGGDTAAYFAGRAFGKHKLAPYVSPKKTIEGSLGGLIGGILAGFVYCKVKKISFFAYLDLIVPSIALAQGFGRLGCFLAGCCYGMEAHTAFAITFTNSAFAPNGVPLVPTQLISSAFNFANFAVLCLIASRKVSPGKVSACYLIFYSVGRFIIEFFRGDLIRGSVGPLSTSQFISIFVAIFGVALLFISHKLEKRNINI